MENASKALVMAGAVLVSLALVGLGVYIFSMSKRTADPEILEIHQIQTLNSQLSVYAGEQVRGSTIKEFLSLVETLNTKGTFPKNIFPGTVTNYTFTANGTTITAANISDIEENAYYEMALQDNLPTVAPDGVLDTYQIIAY